MKDWLVFFTCDLKEFRLSVTVSFVSDKYIMYFTVIVNIIIYTYILDSLLIKPTRVSRVNIISMLLRSLSSLIHGILICPLQLSTQRR
jgi:hypothetical protein